MHGQGRGRVQQREENQKNERMYETRNSRGRGRGRYISRYEKSSIECYNCQKFGHYASECHTSQNQVEEKSNLTQDKGNIDEPTLLLEHKGEKSCEDNLWYLDSGASYHMCGNKKLFVDLDKNMNGKVTFGNSSGVSVKGKGNILIRLKNGDHNFISSVYYVPNMKNNILSLGQLMEKVYTIIMKDGFLNLRDSCDNLIAKVPMTKNRMFIIKIQSDVAKCLKAFVGDSSWLWHLRFGHLNFDSLNSLSRKHMVNGLPHIDHANQLCEGYLFGKQSRKRFPKESMTRAREPLQLIQSDVCGPFSSLFFSKNCYFLLFIDDYSRKTWVYFIKEKSQVFECFKIFKI